VSLARRIYYIARVSTGYNNNKEAQPVARQDALLHYSLFLLQYWHSRSSKFDDFYLIWKGEI